MRSVGSTNDKGKKYLNIASNQANSLGNESRLSETGNELKKKESACAVWKVPLFSLPSSSLA